MKPRLSRRWLLVLCVVALAALAVPMVSVLAAHTAQPAHDVCPPGSDGQSCPVSFRTPSILSPASDEAVTIRNLFNFIVVLATIIFVLVEGMLIMAVLRFRNRSAEVAMQFHSNTKLEVAWTAAPGVILAVLLGFTLKTMGEVKAVTSENVVYVKAIGHQWWWEFHYPDLNIVTAEELVVPVGSTIEVAVESVDVEHGFWSPELFGKVDAVPGYTTRVRFTPTTPGAYGGQCTQYCGIQHAQMRLAVKVLSAADFQAWAANQQQPAAPATGDAAAGEKAFLSGQCVVCHTISGTTAAGVIGPNLTHLASRDFIAGGVLANTPENLALWLYDTQAVKPGNLMVIQPLDEQTIQNLVAYLTTLK